MALRHEVLNALARHHGQGNGIKARDLAKQLNVSTRQLRREITSLRYGEGRPICGKPSTGYFMADTAAELEATFAFLHRRVVGTLRTMARMRNCSLPALLGQINLTETADK